MIAYKQVKVIYFIYILEKYELVTIKIQREMKPE